MDFQEIKLTKEQLLPELERQEWVEGVFVGKEGGNFHVDLPKNYEYNQDLRLGDTNSFVIKNDDHTFSIIGEEVQKSFHLAENEKENFENSIKEYLDKAFSYLKSNGIEEPKNLKLLVVKTDNSSWYRANYSFEMSSKAFMKSYNLLGKTLIKLFAGKTLKEAGYDKNKIYREHRIIDFISKKVGTSNKYFALVYSFDEVSTKNTEKMLNVINEISKSLGYYDRDEIS